MASSKVASLAATAGSGGPAASALLGVGTKVSSAPASAPDERRCGAGWNGGGGGGCVRLAFRAQSTNTKSRL